MSVLQKPSIFTHVPSCLLAWNRGFCLFLGGFALLNLVVDFMAPGFDSNEWWIMIPGVSPASSQVFLFLASLTLLGYGMKPAMSRQRRVFTLSILGFLVAATLWNGIEFYSLVARQRIQTGIALPVSFILCGCLLAAVVSAFNPPRCSNLRSQNLRVAFSLAFFLFAFPLLQIFLFGKTSYARPAHAAVVFGARTYANGQPSDALADRVRTACDLYKQGKVRALIFSGGPGDGAIHETEAMRRMAIAVGIPDDAILLDRMGLNTDATIANLRQLKTDHHFGRVLAVSHFYHLPRIKMASHQAGFEVYTVPAKESYLLKQMPYFIARETAAIWAYYLHPFRSLTRRA